MYGESVFLAGAHVRRGWSTLAGFTLQCAILGAGLLLPLLNPEGLPRVFLTQLLVAPSPPLPPPPPPPDSGMAPRVRHVAPERTGGLMLAPPAIPKRVAMVIDDLPLGLADSETQGVIGGIYGGVQNGVVGSLMQASRQAVTPPPPPPARTEPAAAKPIPRILVTSNLQEAMLVHRVIPDYPVVARQMRIHGEVKFSALISREGTVQNLTMLYGHPMLIPAAVEAIRKWRYRPTILNGEPHEVVTTILVTFKLN